ncbi:hypothetical protein [Methylobacterium sp. 22177]|uniref:hypothetical protein n=1 Tax=Methylobacterium sp. 22177 TaxID=3453885 RepID=UPI003F846EF9
MSTQIDQLNTELKAAQVALDAALVAGEPSRSDRNEVARLEAELATAQQAEAAEKAIIAAQEAEEIQAAGIALADAQHAAIAQSGAAVALAEIAPEDTPIVAYDPAIESAAQRVATAQAAMDKAAAAHGELTEAADKLRATLAAKQGALAELKARRAAGTSLPEDALEALGLPDDIADLERLVAIAAGNAASALPTAEQAELAAAQKLLAETKTDATLRVARERIALAERTFLLCYQELRGAEQASGRYQFRPSGDYRASSDLKLLVSRHG